MSLEFKKLVGALPRLCVAGFGLTMLAGLQGCQTYTPAPINLDDYARQWVEQSLTDDTLEEFASGLMSEVSTQAVFNVSDGVSLPEAQLISLLFNPSLEQSRLESRLPLTRKKRSALFPDPEIELDFEPVREGVDEDLLLNGKLGFVLPLSFRVKSELQQIDSQYEAELVNLLRDEQDTLRQVHDLWVESFVHQKKRQVMTEHLNGLEDVIEQAGQSLTLTSMSAADLQSLALDATGIRADLLAVKECEVENHSELMTLLGLKEDSTLVFNYELSVMEKSYDHTQWQQLLTENDVEMQLAKARYLVAENTLQLEIKKQYPDLVLGPIYQKGESDLGLGITSILPIWNRNLPSIEYARIKREVARKQVEQVYQARINTLISIEKRLQLLEERKQFFTDRLTPMIDQQFENIWQGIQLGTANVLLLQDTLRQRLDSKLDMLETISKQTVLKNQMITMLESAHGTPVDLSPFKKQIESKGE